MSPLPLSVLDLAPQLPEGGSVAGLAHSLDLLRAVEDLGYRRLWYAEHHNMAGIVSADPALMIARAASASSRIRLGSGGVMLPNHAPLKVAESYRLLEAMAPGRIDLGLGRAPGTDQRTALALRRSPQALGADDFEEQLEDLLAFSGVGFPGGHPFQGIQAQPTDQPLPPLWLLGSSEHSALLAARLGQAYAFAGHFSPQPPDGPMLLYRHRFQPGVLQAPQAMLALSVFCADTEEEAEALARPIVVAFTQMLTTGRFGRLLSVPEAMAYPFSDLELRTARSVAGMHITGTPSQVVARLQALAERTEADELMIATLTTEPVGRIRSFALLAEAWGLKPATCLLA